ncbi:uncharacterized protein BO87DRAFT_448524 [Aspergillus neoniger CBS 115656]|uniref:Uncharacterized protein n=1 Tax=Aspergillus neoniger (strain CBS 115656) TaxID=1448310 RepID=A0A318YV73_ASPNB|nr:hypothetical protein BO87DRAFT_448524 [Aspergillus neoniger CBS 115656]PYH37897.1 hypothetical protein BO87DRAFT_448524 [Aspergillus neoniger CBS 115656]
MSPGTCLTNWVYGVLWLCHRSDRWEAAGVMKGNAGNAGVMSGRRRDYTVDTGFTHKSDGKTPSRIRTNNRLDGTDPWDSERKNSLCFMLNFPMRHRYSRRTYINKDVVEKGKISCFYE